jgi:DNA-binding response OmpR family regulator
MEAKKKFDKDRRGDIDIFLGEPNEQVRESMRAMLRGEGYKRTRTFYRMEDLMAAFNEYSPDLLILSDDLHASAFQLIKDIRHFRVGRNPFIVISMMVSGDGDAGIKKAILGGCDDVMIKPVAPGKMLDRIIHLTFNRIPFIATTDYVGPERRRTTDRPSKIRQLIVVNSLRDKAEGKRLSVAELSRQVERCMTDVMAARLDSHGLKLGYICNLILKAYEEKKVTKEIHDNLLVLVSVLEDAGRTAKHLGEPDLNDICNNLARQVEELAEDYQNPSDVSLGTLRKLVRAFDLAKQATEKRFSSNVIKPEDAKPVQSKGDRRAQEVVAKEKAAEISGAQGADVTIRPEDLAGPGPAKDKPISTAGSTGADVTIRPEDLLSTGS